MVINTRKILVLLFFSMLFLSGCHVVTTYETYSLEGAHEDISESVDFKINLFLRESGDYKKTQIPFWSNKRIFKEPYLIWLDIQGNFNAFEILSFSYSVNQGPYQSVDMKREDFQEQDLGQDQRRLYLNKDYFFQENWGNIQTVSVEIVYKIYKNNAWKQYRSRFKFLPMFKSEKGNHIINAVNSA